MDNFSRFKNVIGACEPHVFSQGSASLPELLIPEQSNHKVKTYYAPFDHINTGARLILVGITPGRTQMNNALHAACEGIHLGLTDELVLRKAKLAGAFSGKMKKTLIQLLDRWEIPAMIGAKNASSFWDSHADLVHFTSSLRNPVFCGDNETNYTGSNPSLSSYAGFRLAVQNLIEELMRVPNGLILPLGAKVTPLINKLVKQGSIPINRVLNLNGDVCEFPHPSGANRERCNLALIDSLPASDDYVTQKLEIYKMEKLNERKPLSPDQILSYSNERRSYWRAAEKTRFALENLRLELRS